MGVEKEKAVTDDFPIPDIEQSNARFDHEHGDGFVPVRSAWRESLFMRRGKLTDKKIARYERLGFYSAEYRTARKALMDRKARQRTARVGNFDLVGDRMIYNPK